MPTITTFLTFDNQTEEAVALYVSLFDDGRILDTRRYGEGAPAPKGSVMSQTFQIFGQTFIALNGGSSFKFGQGMSLMVQCDNQAQIDRYWEKLTEGGKEIQCGWLTDRFGVTWQIVPTELGSLLGSKDSAGAGRAMQAMLKMKKLDIAALNRAYDGE